MKHVTKIGFFIAILILVLQLAVPVFSVASVAITITLPANVASNSDFTATINIGSVTDLNALQYDISFDSTKLRLDSTSPGIIGSKTMPLQSNVLSAGRLRVIQYLGLSTVSGSGTLATLNFHIVATTNQSTSISLSNGVLSGMSGEIPATWNSAQTTITGLSPTPVTTTPAPTNTTQPPTVSSPTASPSPTPALTTTIAPSPTSQPTTTPVPTSASSPSPAASPKITPTAASAPSLPYIKTEDVIHVAKGVVTLKGVLTNTGDSSAIMVSFEWGETLEYGNITPYQTVVPFQEFTFEIIGLNVMTEYHYRVRTVDGYGQDVKFVTPSLVFNNSGSTPVPSNATGNQVQTPMTALPVVTDSSESAAHTSSSNNWIIYAVSIGCVAIVGTCIGILIARKTRAKN